MYTELIWEVNECKTKVYVRTYCVNISFVDTAGYRMWRMICVTG
jgi:hypothetical protein